MANYDTDQAKEFRRARLLAIKPYAAAMALPEATFQTEFVQYHLVVRDRMAEAEEVNRCMFCPACQTSYGPTMVKARVLRVHYEEDVLRNFPAVATVACQGCGWEELIPVIVPEVSDEDRALVLRAKRAALTSLRPNQAGQLTPDAWSDDISYATGIRDVPLAPRSLHGQRLADQAWKACADNEKLLREAALARAQLPQIEEIEAKQSLRATSKAATYGQAYGMGQAKLSDVLQQQNMMMGQTLARNIDASVLKQIAMNAGLQNAQDLFIEQAKKAKEEIEKQDMLAAHAGPFEKFHKRFRKQVSRK